MHEMNQANSIESVEGKQRNLYLTIKPNATPLNIPQIPREASA